MKNELINLFNIIETKSDDLSLDTNEMNDAKITMNYSPFVDGEIDFMNSDDLFFDTIEMNGSKIVMNYPPFTDDEIDYMIQREIDERMENEDFYRDIETYNYEKEYQDYCCDFSKIIDTYEKHLETFEIIDKYE